MRLFTHASFIPDSSQFISWCDSKQQDFLLNTEYFIYYVRRLWFLLKSFILFSIQLPCFNLAQKSCPTFVGCGSNDNNMFRASAVPCWLAWLILCLQGSHWSLRALSEVKEFSLQPLGSGEGVSSPQSTGKAAPVLAGSPQSVSPGCLWGIGV